MFLLRQVLAFDRADDFTPKPTSLPQALAGESHS